MDRHLRSPRLLTAVLAATLALAFLGCSSSHSSSKSISVQTPEGTASLSLDGKLPPDWPAGFPLPPGATPAGSGSIGNTQEAHMIGVFETSSTGTDTFNFYKNSSTLTVSQPKSVGTGNSFVGTLQFSGPYSGSVTVTDLSDTTHMVVYLKTSTNHSSPVSGQR
jgi:hypothetical protein